MRKMRVAFIATATTWPIRGSRRPTSSVSTCGSRARRYEPDPAVRKDAGRLGRGEVRRRPRSRGSGAGGRRSLYGRLDQHGTGSRVPEAARRLQGVLRRCGAAAACGSRGDRDALPSRPPWRGDHRGVFEGPHSAVFDEAENRLHVQMASWRSSSNTEGLKGEELEKSEESRSGVFWRVGHLGHPRVLVENYGCEVIAFVADLGQGEELGPVRAKARKTGARRSTWRTCRRVRPRLRLPALMANAVYEGQYLLGTSIARPLIAKKQIEIARKEKADAVSTAPPGRGTTRSASSSPTTP